MILADTSVWITHFREGVPHFQKMLDKKQVLTHPFVIGEIALGSLKNRRRTLAMMGDLEQSKLAGGAEVAALIEWGPLHGAGVGYVDAHLLASVRLTADAQLWTLDKRLHGVATRMEIAAAIDLG